MAATHRQPRVWTLPELLAHCHEVGDCLEWRGMYANASSPLVSHAGRKQSVRALVLALSGKPLAKGCKPMTTCQNPRCVNPDHLRRVTLADFARLRVVPRTNQPLRAAKIAAARRKGARLTDADVHAIRACPEPAHVWATRLGVSVGYINTIRRNDCWRAHTGSVWSGMGARA